MSLALRRSQKTLQVNHDLVDFLIVDPDTRQTIEGATPANLARLWCWLNASSQRQAAAVMAIDVFCLVVLFFSWLGREANEWSHAIAVSLIIIASWFVVSIDAQGVYYKWVAEN